ncbi:MAG TPA: M20/M25/M40 family metallo-hydrolase [Pyrinomonadaceae bacterium]|jgi:membrane-associated protease RseP (regulator of RpoE activity)|nr:M20/M25/M40 family metallo-hydrolase [Pyrinomonadaceae bacterium]
MISSASNRRALASLLLVLALAPVAPARQKPQGPPSADLLRLREHVAHLASDELQGRRTGTRGAQEAANYIAEEFHELMLAPGGNSKEPRYRNRVEPREYLQEFPYVAGVELGKENAMSLLKPRPDPPLALDLRAGEDWMPLGFSSNAKLGATPVVFAGFGITAAEQSYDDYKGADVRGKIALAFAGTPDAPGDPHGRFTRAGEPRFKAAAALAAGAAALVLVSRETNFKDDKLSRLAYDNAAGDAGLPVAVVSRQVAARLLGRESPGALDDLEIRARLLKTPSRIFEEPDTRMPQGMTLSLTVDLVRKNAPAHNVVGVLTGSDPKLKDEVIVVGAHYDHLGTGGEGSLAAREGEVHHGADDNASGTAALIELARLLTAEKEKMRRTVVFVAFGGEEEGLLGSSFYVRNAGAGLGQVVAMLNMDMVGRLREDSLSVGGVGTAAEWRAVLGEANRQFKVSLDPSLTGGTRAEDSNDARRPPGEAPIVISGSNGRAAMTAVESERFKLRLNEDGFGPSDHASFYLKKVPVLFFFTGAHEDYHKPSDTADRINYEGLARVLEFVREIVYTLQVRDARPTFAVARAESGARSTGFRVYLGTIPSYGESTDGLKIEGVREGSPAAAAGVQAGDRVVKLAGRDVRNVYDYTQALSGMEAGKEYEVELLRGDQRLKLKVTPAARR